MIKGEKGIVLLKDKLKEMGALAEQAVQRSLRAFSNRDDGLASSAKEHDKAIDELEIEIDELATDLLVTTGSAREGAPHNGHYENRA